MAEPARRGRATEEAPTYDPRSIERALAEQRARRAARTARERARRNARIRFFAVIVALLAGAVALGVVAWHEIQRLFGL
jgi:hypothetical protein